MLCVNYGQGKLDRSQLPCSAPTWSVGLTIPVQPVFQPLVQSISMLSMSLTAPKKAATAITTGCRQSSSTTVSSAASRTCSAAAQILLRKAYHNRLFEAQSCQPGGQDCRSSRFWTPTDIFLVYATSKKLMPRKQPPRSQGLCRTPQHSYSAQMLQDSRCI